MDLLFLLSLRFLSRLTCVGYTDDQLKTDASGRHLRMTMVESDGKFHEDDEHSNAAYVSIFLFHIPCRSWYLLGSKCCSKVCSRLLSITVIWTRWILKTWSVRIWRRWKRAKSRTSTSWNAPGPSECKNINKIKRLSGSRNVETKSQKGWGILQNTAAKPDSITAKSQSGKTFDERKEEIGRNGGFIMEENIQFSSKNKEWKWITKACIELGVSSDQDWDSGDSGKWRRKRSFRNRKQALHN